MSLNSFEHDIAQALGLDFDYKTERKVFYDAVAAELKKYKGHMREIILGIQSQGGFNPRDIPERLKFYLAEANETDAELQSELARLQFEAEAKDFKKRGMR